MTAFQGLAIHPTPFATDQTGQDEAVSSLVVEREREALLPADVRESVETDQTRKALTRGEASPQIVDFGLTAADPLGQHTMLAHLRLEELLEVLTPGTAQQIRPSTLQGSISQTEDDDRDGEPEGDQSEHHESEARVLPQRAIQSLHASFRGRGR